MKNFDNVRMSLFDSTNAHFKLALEATFTRRKDDGTYRDLVYVASYTANLNPNIYITFSYRSDDPQNQPRAVYMSYPQLFRLREAMETIKSMIVDDSGFSEVDGVVVVKPGCDEPVTVSNIGKGNNWISFKLGVFESAENGVSTSAKCVSIDLSTSHPQVSILSVEEFLTIYTIVKDLNLSAIQCMLSLAFLDCNRQGGQSQVYPQPYGQAQQPFYGQAAPAYPQAQQPYFTQRQPMGNGSYQQTPRYQGNNPYRPAPRPMRQQVQAPQSLDKPVSENPAPLVPPQPKPAPLSPRESSSGLGNLKAGIENTPVMENYFDEADIDAIFDE